jgi:CheY-like chemotaxis protein
MEAEFTILIADRSRANREFLRREFLREGYGVRLARECGEVWTILKGFDPPDLLILDLEIPACGGWGLLSRLRREAPGLPVIVLHTPETAYARERALECAVALLAKDLRQVDRLKKLTAEILRCWYPFRCGSRGTAPSAESSWPELSEAETTVEERPVGRADSLTPCEPAAAF